MTRPQLPIRTTRLVLRAVTAADADALLADRSLPEVCRYVPFAPMTADDIAVRLAGLWSHTGSGSEGDGIFVGVALADTDRVIGDLTLFGLTSEHRGAEIGWVLDPAQSGHGYATEAAHALLHLAFDGLRRHRVVARVDARNRASLALCERLGMRREAYLVRNEWFKGQWSDEVDYALLEDEWARSSFDGHSVRPTP